MKALFYFAAMSLAIQSANAQQYLGLGISNYDGIDGSQYNPAASMSYKLKYDIRIARGGVFVHNEYAYLMNESVLSAISKRNGGSNGTTEAIFVDSIANKNITSGTLLYDFFNVQSPFNNVFQAEVGGPGFLVRKEKFAFGVFTNLKANFTALNMDKILNFDTLDNLTHRKIYPIDKMEINGAVYTEIGANFAYDIETRNENNLHLGINAKLLLAQEGYYGKSLTNTTFSKTRDSVNIYGGNIELGFATGLSSDLKSYKPGIQGMGAAFDLGMEYLIKSNNDKQPYRLKIGATVKDIGWISYNKNAYELNANTTQTMDMAFAPFKGNINYTNDRLLLSKELLNDSTTMLIGNSFTLFTPMALQIQGDYSITKNFFVHFNLSRRLSVFHHQLSSANSISIVPRFEHRWFEMGIPMSLIEDKLFGMGAYVRLAFLTIGTEQLNSLVFKQAKLQGFDFYFSLRFNPWKNKVSTGRKHGKSRDYDCFKF